MFENQITVDDYLQFFCVFNDENENIGGNTGKNQDRQLLYLSNVNNYYNPFNGKFAMQVLTFSSVNDRIVASGQNTMDFVQYASPGSGYAFPTIINSVVTLNRVLMHDIGIRYAHVQTYGLELLCSNYYFGRPIIQGQAPNQIGIDEIFEQKIFASRRLFIAGNNEFSTTSVKNNAGLFAGINDQVTTNSHPETTFYNIMDCQPTGFTNYKDWQSFLSAKQFDLLAEKDFKGVLKFDESKGSASIGDITNLKVGDTISLTATPNTNFTLSKVLFNGEEITNYESILITEEENELIVQFYTEEYETTDLYFKDLGGMNNPSTHGIIYLFNDKDGMENGKFGSTEINFVTYNADGDNANYYLAEDIDITNYDNLIFAVIDNNGTTRGQTQNLLISDIGENNLYSLTGTFDETSENKVYEGSFGTIAQQTLTINETTNGTVTANKTTGIKGEEVILTVTPEEGYELDTLTFNSEEVTSTEGTYKINLVEGENIINATFKEIVEPVDTYTIYFKDASWWNSDAASTRINLFKNSELVVDSDAMNYMTNPGYFNGSNYWSYDVNLADYDQVQFLRYNSSGTEKYNETSIIDLSEEYNCYSFVLPDEGDFIIEQSYINVEDILRDEAVINITYSIEDVCVARLSSSTPLVGDTLSISYDMVDGYEIESVTANNVALDNIYQLNVTESTINLVINLVENANIRTIYVQTSTSIRDHQYAPQAYLFLFTDSGGDNGGWPGQQMTFVETLETGERIYSIAGVDISAFEEAIFMIGWTDNNCAKTNDLLLSEIGDNNMYVFTDSSDNFIYNGYWTTYSK